MSFKKNLPEDLVEIIENSLAYAESLGSQTVFLEHILKEVIEPKQGLPRVKLLLTSMNLPVESIIQDIENYCKGLKSTTNRKVVAALSVEVLTCIASIDIERETFACSEPDPTHMFLAILKYPTSFINTLTDSYPEFNYDDIADRYEMLLSDMEGPHPVQDPSSFTGMEDDFIANLVKSEKDEIDDSLKKKKAKKKTPALDAFSINLSQLDREGKLDPIVGRFSEVERTIQILSRKKKNNPVLIGEPGVGKTAIAEGLAIRINRNEVPISLQDKTILSLDLVSVVAGTKFRGEFEQRIKEILSELKENRDLIIFIDELHTIVGAGNSSGQMDAANILKPALARGEIQCIGATTIKEYRENIESDGALERRFQKVRVEPTSEEDTLTILENIVLHYENHHLVSFSKEAIKACVDFSVRYITDRHLPDKAIDLMDESGSRVNIKNMKTSPKLSKLEDLIKEQVTAKDEAVVNQMYELAAEHRAKELEYIEAKEALLKAEKSARNSNRTVVTEEHVAEVISLITGIPVTKISSKELDKLKEMEKVMTQKVVGQNDAIKKVVKSIKRSRLGFSDPNKPIGSFLFTGPTGVGKTQLSKVLAEELFNSKEALIRIDMSEFTHKHEVSKLIGSAPGFVGYKEGGRLTEAVRKNPYSVVLLDEIEKAHEEVYNVFLQVLDDGILTDGLGKTVNFKNTVFIMTSNVGSRVSENATESVGFGASNLEKKKEALLDKALKSKFSPEFLNRLDGVIKFNYLSEENISSILEIELKKVLSRIENKGYTITLTPEAKRFLVEKGFERKYGARPLKRALQEYVEDYVVSEILDNNLGEGSKLTITHVKGELSLSKKKTYTKKPKQGVVKK